MITFAHTPQKGHQSLRRGRVSLPNHAYLVTTTTSGRTPIFSHFDAACAACRCFSAPALLGNAQLLAWVLMPDHVHWLIQLGQEDSLQTVVNRLKSASARATNKVLLQEGTVWDKAYHDQALRKEDDLANIARYIVANPLRAGLVTQLGAYPFWNAVWLS